jgi:cell division initiation protein
VLEVWPLVKLTPLEIQNKEFKRGFRGYAEDDVEEFLDEVLKDYEFLYKENMDLKEKIKTMENQIAQYQNLENTLKDTLLVAQETAESVKNLGQKEAEAIIADARKKAQQMIEEAEWKVEKLNGNFADLKKQIGIYAAKTKSLLMSQMELLETISVGSDELEG